MPDIKQPQDHKSSPKQFTFERDDETYVLPFASEGAAKVPGRLTRDAVMGEDDAAQTRLAFALLEACEPPKDVLDVLYSMPTPEMMEILVAWMRHGDGDGADLGKS